MANNTDMIRGAVRQQIDAYMKQHGGLSISTAAMGRPEIGMTKHGEEHLRKMLASRMGWDVNPGVAPFSFCTPHKLNDDTVVVFVVADGKGMVIEDELGLYPSDALVTQLRLLGG